jgi:hypothetical protein
MKRVLLHPRPRRALVPPGPRAAVLRCGAIGYLDAAEDDRQRWIAGFRALLDGLDGPLQAVVDFVPGSVETVSGGQPATAELPQPGGRRAADLAFAQAVRDSPSARRRDVRLVTSPPAADALHRSLREMGVLDVARLERCPTGGALFGVETATALHDRLGWHRTWCLDRYPGGELTPGWLLRLAPPGLHLSLSWHADRLPTAWVVEYLQRQLVHLRASQLHQAGGVGDPKVEGAAPTVEALQRRLTDSQESAFHVSLYLTVSTTTAEALDAASAQLEAAARSALCHLLPCTFRQLDGRLATLPMGRDRLGRRRVLDTSALATLFPWFDADLQEEAGVVVGQSRATGAPVLVDPFDDRRHANANIGIFGHSGAGKTYLLSTLAMGALGLGTQVFVIDPEHEYGALARRLGGLDIQLALGSGHAINVLDLRGTARDEATLGPTVADTVDLCGVVCGELDEAERATLETAVRATFEAVETPVLGDVAARLPADSRVARVLARWVQGSLGQLFSRPTNVDLDASIVVFGMRELRAEMVAPVHYLLAEALWARIKGRDRRRLLVIDELGLLFEDPTVRRFVVSLARRIRKYDGSLVFATQNPGDLLGGDAGAVVATNPALHFFGAQRPGEAAKLQQAFHLSEAQRTGLEVAQRGEFLLAAGPARLTVRVQAPPWQAAAMVRSRAPPLRRIESHGRVKSTRPARGLPPGRRMAGHGRLRRPEGSMQAPGRNGARVRRLARGTRLGPPVSHPVGAAGHRAGPAGSGRLCPHARRGDRRGRRRGRRRLADHRRCQCADGRRGPGLVALQRLSVMGFGWPRPAGRRRARLVVDHRVGRRQRRRCRRGCGRGPVELHQVHLRRGRAEHDPVRG